MDCCFIPAIPLASLSRMGRIEIGSETLGYFKVAELLDIFDLIIIMYYTCATIVLHVLCFDGVLIYPVLICNHDFESLKGKA